MKGRSRSCRIGVVDNSCQNVVKVMTHLECLLGVVTLPSGLTQNCEGFHFCERIHNFVNKSSYCVQFTRSFTAAPVVHDRPDRSRLRLMDPLDPADKFSTDPLFSISWDPHRLGSASAGICISLSNVQIQLVLWFVRSWGAAARIMDRN